MNLRTLPKRLYEPIIASRLREPLISIARPVVSFTFDDAPVSAFELGGKILADADARGTFYVSGAECGQDGAVGRLATRHVIAAAGERGHEIANHGYRHVDMTTLGARSARSNVRRNSSVFDGSMSMHFAYPFGSSDVLARWAIRELVVTARGVRPGVNHFDVDRLDLRAVAIYSMRGLGECRRAIEACTKDGGWLIFYTHDVAAAPSEFGCTPDHLESLVAQVLAADLPIETVTTAWRGVGSAATA